MYAQKVAEFRKFKCDALRDLLPFVQFKKRENVHGGVLFLVKLYKWYQITQRITSVFSNLDRNHKFLCDV